MSTWTSNWSFIDFDLGSIQGNRPYSLIKIPNVWLTSSRIINQEAALLFPDTIPVEDVLEKYTPNNPDAIESMKKHWYFIEDLSKAYNCEKFLFVANENHQPLNIDRESIYPIDDFTHTFLEGWMKTFHQSPFGTIPMVVAGDNTYLSRLHSKLANDDLNTMYEKSWKKIQSIKFLTMSPKSTPD